MMVFAQNEEERRQRINVAPLKTVAEISMKETKYLRTFTWLKKLCVLQ